MAHWAAEEAALRLPLEQDFHRSCRGGRGALPSCRSLHAPLLLLLIHEAARGKMYKLADEGTVTTTAAAEKNTSSNEKRNIHSAAFASDR